MVLPAPPAAPVVTTFENSEVLPAVSGAVTATEVAVAVILVFAGSEAVNVTVKLPSPLAFVVTSVEPSQVRPLVLESVVRLA